MTDMAKTLDKVGETASTGNASEAPAKPRRNARKRAAPGASARTLSIDVGGSGLKASVLDQRGKMLVDRVRVETPKGAHPKRIVEALALLVKPLPPYGRVSVGFPGMVREGKVLTAPNLGHPAWKGFALGSAIEQALGKPVRVLNDADMAGFGVIRGRGVEMVVTLGTGFGTALFWNGRLAPHLEIAHQPFRRGQTYDQQLGDRARRRLGVRHWSRRVALAIDNLRTLVSFDHLFLGGGNARKLKLKLPKDCSIVSNQAGIVGGIALWREA